MSSIAPAPLRDAALAPRTLSAYNTALETFLLYTRRTFQQILLMHATHIDIRLSAFIDHLFLSSASKTTAAHAIFALAHHRPDLKKRLGQAHRRLAGWHRLTPSVSYPPITWELTVVIAVALARGGYHGEATSCLLAFHCYLRVGELVNLRIRDVILPHDPRMGRAFVGMALRLRTTKTGPEQWVEIRRDDVGEILSEWIARRALLATSMDDFVFPFTADHLRKMLRRACDSLGVGDSHYTPHSFRHGGATADFLRGVSIEHVMFRGRWQSQKSARHYLGTGRGHLAAQTVPPDLYQLGITFDDTLTEVMSHLLATVPLVGPCARRARHVRFHL
jgi:integrase